MIEGPIQIKDITFINVYAPDIGALIYKANINGIKGEIKSPTIIIGGLKHPTYINELIIQTENQ